MANVIQFQAQRAPLAKHAPRFECRPDPRRPTDELEPLVSADRSGDGRIIIRVPFAGAYVTTEQALEFARRLLDLVHDETVK